MQSPLLSRILLSCLGLALLCTGKIVAAPIDFGRDIRPILSENCFYCHGQDPAHRKAKLRLDTLQGQRTNDVVIPGDATKSELIKRIFTEDPDDLMPPPDSNRALTTEQKALLKRWISEGAPFGGHWAFTTPQSPALPPVKKTGWIRNEIDRFILAKLEANHLKPSPEASRPTLLRRVTLDLTGLPPTPEELQAFLNDKKPGAYERAVDRLLASPHYGERMALPWLDAARYADSNGFQQDGDTFQWIWRDWLVRALNGNMPFDQFTIEQLAGDLLPNPTVDQKIATGFNRNHMLNGEGGAIPEEQRHVILFDRVDTTATTWLGLTVACAQCHDHKYDPIKQSDYYSLLAAFNHLPENGVTPIIPFKVRVAEPLLDVASPEQKAKLADLQGRLTALKEKEKDFTSKLAAIQREWEEKVAADDQFPDKLILEMARLPRNESPGRRESKLKAYFNEKVLPTLPDNPTVEVAKRDRELNNYKNDDYPRVMVMAETKPRDTFILDRGNYESRLQKVAFGTPGFLPPLPTNAPQNRLGLARWLVSPEQPLTARVMMNRFWQTFFGLGLVKTSEDFGLQSEPPKHAELLDWLACDFRDHGWDMKRAQRQIVTSATYRQVSSVTPFLLERDPENRLFARGPRFRLPSLLIRDQALAVSGLLVTRLGGKPVYPYQPRDIWDSLAITKERDFTYPQSTGEDLHRRSLYTFWRRTVAPANLFDASSRNVCKVRLGTTSTPLHALTLLNDPTYLEAARALAEEGLCHTDYNENKRLALLFQRVLARQPDATEIKLLRVSLEKQLSRFQGDPPAALTFLSSVPGQPDSQLDPVRHAAYAMVCLGILNLDETLTKP